MTPETRFDKVAQLWLTEFERAVDDGRRSPGTLDTYRSVYRVHVRPALGELLVREVTTPVIDRALVAVGRRSTARARTSKIVVSRTMAFAARHGAVVVNPAREVGRIEDPPRRRPRAMTAGDRAAWLAALEADELARRWDLPDITRIMLATGCRIGECLAVGWTEVDLPAGVLDVRWRLVRRTGVGLLRVPSTKTGERGERLVPLPSWAVELLGRRCERIGRRRERIGASVEAVFPDSVGGWRDPANVRRAWRGARDRARMDGLVTHTLRKTVASFLDDADVSARRISDQLGHARVRMTQDVYLGRRLVDRVTADVLEGILGDDGGQPLGD